MTDSAPKKNVDRLPPHAPEAEQGVIGCCLINPRECIGECLTSGIVPETFYDLRHQTIFRVLVEMSEVSLEQIDMITLMQRLKDDGFLDQIGGITYLSELQDSVPSASNLSYYSETLREKYTLRRMVSVCTDVVGRVYDYEGEVDALMDEVERDVLKISQSRVSSETPPIKTLVGLTIDKIQEYFQRKGQLGGLETGFIDFDKMTDGLQPSEMIVIAGRPSTGKTSISMNIVEHVAVEKKIPVGVFSLEMSAEALTMRMTCSLARVSLSNVRSGDIHESDFPKLASAGGRIARAPIFIDDTGGLSVLQLRARARRMHQIHGIKLFVIDYLQLMHSSAKRSKENRQQEIADISSGIKTLAKELKVPVIVLSQLNRELDKDKNRKPRLSDLRESGAIEQDADLVGLLYKPKNPNPPKSDNDEDNSEPDDGSINLLIAKARNGPVGDVNLTFIKPFCRFESAAKVSQEDVSRERRMNDA